MTISLPPLSLYIHIPWCVRKCPYCDFNSHEGHGALPEAEYVAALLEDLDSDLPLAAGRELRSIFFGGGTPSLFSPTAIGDILDGVRRRLPLSAEAEITLEANPGTAEQHKFTGYREAGVNRLSIGVQSFQADKLSSLGRIHSANEAQQAIAMAKTAGFRRFNIDLMHGLPGQTTEDALGDLRTALELGATHLSWYQLTIEPNTAFYKQPPPLPADNLLADIQEQGQRLLAEYGLQQYEVSAYARPGQESLHNLNYWQFGDYLGIGAGAHGKLTDVDAQQVLRYQKTRKPEDYLLRAGSRSSQCRPIPREDLPLEFMLNALRLNGGFTPELFSQRTGLPWSTVKQTVAAEIQRGLLEYSGEKLRPTELGRRYLNDLVSCFLAD